MSQEFFSLLASLIYTGLGAAAGFTFGWLLKKENKPSRKTLPVYLFVVALLVCFWVAQIVFKKLSEQEIMNYQKALQMAYGEPSGDYENILFEPYQEAGIEKYILLTASKLVGIDTRLCDNPIDGAIFSKLDGKWKVSNTQKNIVTVGCSHKGQIVKIGPEKYGFVVNSMFTGTGVTSTTYSLITSINGVLKQVLFDSEFERDENNDCSVKLSGCHSFIATEKYAEGTIDSTHPFFNIVIEKKGTIIDNNLQAVPFSESRTHTFDYQVGQYY